jgi:hypothetical protein
MFGGLASLVAAYALVFNVVLSSLVTASMSPAAFAASMEICANNPDIAAAHDDAGKTTGKPAVHCPVCVGSHAAGTPPPSGPSFAVRTAVVVAPDFAPAADVVADATTSSHRARAPPHLS